MRENDRNPLAEELAEKLLDAALSNYRGAEPGDGFEERVLANLRQQSRVARPVSWNLAPVMIAVAAALTLFAIDHLIYHQAASVPDVVAATGAGDPRNGVESKPDVPQAQAAKTEAKPDSAKLAKAFVASAQIHSTARRQDLALNLNPRVADEREDGGFQVEELRISEVRLDDIVFSNNERQE